MLKKIKLFIMFVIITTTLVSCVNVDFHLNVKNSSQSEIEIVVKYDKNYSYINNNIDSILYYLKDKYEIEKINNGYKLKTKLNLEKISSNSTIILPITNFSYEITIILYLFAIFTGFNGKNITLLSISILVANLYLLI